VTTVRLLSFYGGKPCWKRSAERLESQADEFPQISSVSLWNPERLKDSDIPEKEAILDLAKEEPKGFGLWSWKLPIVREELMSLRDDELLLYLDSGCSLNSTPVALARFVDYMEIAASDDGMFFAQKLLESHWTKGELKSDFPDESLWIRGQLLGGIFFLNNSKRAVNFVHNVVDVMARNSFEALKNPKADQPQAQGFMEHRNDQSVISLSAKQAGLPVIEDETYFAPNWYSEGSSFPIWATRLCSGNGDVSTRLSSRIRREVERRLPW
jgi:hypothetical protein